MLKPQQNSTVLILVSFLLYYPPRITFATVFVGSAAVKMYIKFNNLKLNLNLVPVVYITFFGGLCVYIHVLVE